MVQHVLERVLRLPEFLALHRAGLVEDDDHIFGDDLRRVHVEARRGEQEKEALACVRVAIRQKIQADMVSGHGVVQVEVGVRGDVVRLVACREAVVCFAITRDGDVVRGRVDRAHGVGRGHLHGDAHLLQRLRRELLGVERVAVMN